ncbi:MAG: GEVED domain-containing protein, partial [Bacteroidota bacterium]
DWGDFAIYNGVLYDFDGKTSGQENAQHHNLQTGATTNLYSSPGLTFIPRQVSIDWAGNMYNMGTAATSSSGTIVPYTNGTITTAQQHTITRNSVAVSGSWGDAAEAFKPRVDFGDAPATYDPNALAPALHETSSLLRLGTAEDVEWTKTSSVNADADGGDEDGLPFVQVLNNAGNYYTDVDVYNNTGANATVCAWIDFDMNGVFNAGEGISQTVASSATTQRIQLYWASVVTSLTNNSYTYIRIRVTSATNAMTTANATGFFSNGEVEDYYVIVNAVALNVKLNKFSAVKVNDELVKLNWSVNGEEAGTEYQVERSDNGSSWQIIERQTATKNDVAVNYTANDEFPTKPNSYYRLKYTDIRNKIHYSQIEQIQFPIVQSYVVHPNPATSNTIISVKAVAQSHAQIHLVDAFGKMVYQQNVILQKGDNKIPVSFTSKLSNGTYLVQLITDGKTYAQKLVINN